MGLFSRFCVTAPGAAGKGDEDVTVCVGAKVADGAMRGCSASDSSDSLTFAVAWLALLTASEATPSRVEL